MIAMRVRTAQRCLALAAVLFVAASCGGGGGGGGGTSVSSQPPPPPTGDWQPGVFAAASTYQAQCRAPRTGIDPATNHAYPDVAGTSTDENNFLRSHSNDTYLW